MRALLLRPNSVRLRRAAVAGGDGRALRLAVATARTERPTATNESNSLRIKRTP
jgi:hypothetical protein